MKNVILIFIGYFFVVLALVGIFLPGLPTTPFLLVSAYCFSKSSPKAYQWLVTNKIFGPIISNWKNSRSIPQSTKRWSLCVILLAAVFAFYQLNSPILKFIILFILLFPALFLLKLRTTEVLSPETQLEIDNSDNSFPRAKK